MDRAIAGVQGAAKRQLVRRFPDHIEATLPALLWQFLKDLV
jgi:hypothetical protein